MRSSPNPCTITQVEQTKLILRIFLIWLTTLIPNTIQAQVNTIFIKQGTTLDRSVGSNTFQIPAASLASFITISMLLSLPIYDRFFVPFMRRRTGNPRGITLLTRLAIGFALQLLCTLVAMFTEMKRMHVIKQHNTHGANDTVPMSIFWLLPQYVILGLGDVFHAIGMLEFFYDQSPEDMKSMGTTFFTSGIGVGNFLNSFLVTMVDELTRRNGKSWIGNNLNDSHLDYYYGFLMGITLLNLCGFWWVASWYKYKEEIEGDGGEVMVMSVEMEKRGGDLKI